jgi:hypothetical protein
LHKEDYMPRTRFWGAKLDVTPDIKKALVNSPVITNPIITGGTISGVTVTENFTSITDPAINAAVTTAIVNTYNGTIITLTGAGNAQTIQTPTAATVKKFTVINNDTSTNSIAANGITLTAGKGQTFLWDGTAWGPVSIGITSVPVPVTEGGTGRNTGSTAYGLLAAGTTGAGAQQTLPAGVATEMLVGGGASGLPVWTTATGSGAPVRATEPAMTAPTMTPAMSKGPAIVNAGFVGTVSSAAAVVTFTQAADAIIAGYRATNPILGTTIVSDGQSRVITGWTSSLICTVDSAPSPAWAADTITSVQGPIKVDLTSAGVLAVYTAADGTTVFASSISVPGYMEAAAGSGAAVIWDQAVGSLAVDTEISGVIRIGATNVLKVYGQADGAGGVKNLSVKFYYAALPNASDGAALGSATLMWSDLFLASGGVINFNNGNVTVTHSAGQLALAGNLAMVGTVSANTAEDTDSDTDDVLVTTIPNTVYGMLIVRESTGTEACQYLLAGGTIEKVSTDATFTVTKDNASTYNVYFEDNVIKVQNKVGDNKNIRCGFFGV